MGLLLLAACSEPRTYSSVAVLPFLDTSPSQAESRHLAEGIAQHLAAKLGGLDGIRIAPFDESRRFADPGIPAQSVSEELAVEAILSGTLRLGAGRIQVGLALTDADGRRIRSATFEEASDRIFDLQGALTREAAGWLRGGLSDQDIRNLGRPPARMVPAWDFYLRGAQAMQADDETSLDLAVGLFRKAVDLDPDLAQAWMGLGAAHNRIYFDGWGEEADLERAERFFGRALQIDPALTEARIGRIESYAGRGLCEEILREGVIEKTADTDLGDITVLALAYASAGLPDEALPLLETVLRFEPDNRLLHYHRVFALLKSGRFEEVMDYGARFLKQHSDGGSVAGDIHWYMTTAAMALGRVEEALEHADAGLRTSDRFNDVAILAYRLAGRRHEADEILEAARDPFPDVEGRNTLELQRAADLLALDGNAEDLLRVQTRLAEVAPGNTLAGAALAMDWLLLGETSRAFPLLQAHQAKGCPTLPLINVWRLYLMHLDLSAESAWRRILEEDRKVADRLRALAGLPAGSPH